MALRGPNRCESRAPHANAGLSCFKARIFAAAAYVMSRSWIQRDAVEFIAAPGTAAIQWFVVLMQPDAPP